jgi:hypothetical protein
MKKLIFLFLMLIGWMSGIGQTNTIRINNFTGINSGCQAEMQTIANELKTILVANGGPVNLFLTKVYPPAVYMKAQDGVNAMEKLAIEAVESTDTNYIHFIAKVKANSEIVELTLQWKLSDSNVGNLCYSKLNFLREHIQKSIDGQISKNASISNLDCVVKTALSEIKLRKISDCSMNALERKAWFEANEFEFHELKGMKLNYGDGALRPKDINKKTTRSTCAYADYTSGDLKYVLSDGGLRQIHALLSDVDIPSERRLIITDKYISESICDSIKLHEMENPSCDVVIWLHFGDTFQGGKDEVGVRIARKNAPGTADSYTYEQLEAQYKLKDTGIFGGFLNIDFRLKNYKSEIIDMINNNEYSEYIPRGAITNAEYYAGFVSGFVDGAIESVDLIYLIAQAAYQSQSSLDPNSLAWWSDLLLNANKKRNLYEAYKDKWNETFDNWVKLKDNVIVMYNSLRNDVIRKEMWRNFSIVFASAISGAGTKLNKWGKDILFISESYDSGYAHGKLGFDLIPVGWLFTVGKGAIGVAKTSKNIVSEIAESVGESMEETTARAVLKRATIDLTELAARLATRPNLKTWFDLDMPALVKVELGKHMDDVDFLDKLETDLGTSAAKLKPYFSSSPEKGIRSYKKLLDISGIRTSVISLETVTKWLDDGIELTFKKSGDNVATVVSKNGDEVAEFVKDGANEFLVISDDFFVSSGTPKSFGSVTVNANTGEILGNVGYVKNADGTIGFIEDVSAYGNATIQNAIKKRGDLRGTINGIQATDDAHHLFPVQTLKENQWVKKGVEGGFEFNTGSVNGMGVRKYVKATNTGRHGPHPYLTKQLDDHMNWWAEQTVNGVKNKNLTPTQTAEYMRVVADDVKQTISTTTTKLNDLDLGLDHF